MKYRRGFTLIELMVVLIVIGLFTGLVTMNMGQNDNRIIEGEAKRLYQVLQLAQDEAIMQGIELGFSLTDTHYSFSRLQESTWLPLTSDKQLSEHDFGLNIDMTLLIENEAVIAQVDTQQKMSPTVMLLSSGEITAFEIAISAQDDNEPRFKINAQENGAMTFYDRYKVQ
jgi:general secretion pathway protein H